MDLKNIMTEIYQIDDYMKFWNENLNIHIITVDIENSHSILIGLNKNTRNIIFQFSNKPNVIIEVNPEYLYSEIKENLELIHYPQRTDGNRIITTRFVMYHIFEISDLKVNLGFHLVTGDIIVRSRFFPSNTYKCLKIDELLEEVENRLKNYKA